MYLAYQAVRNIEAFYFLFYVQKLRGTKQFKFQCCNRNDPYRGVKVAEAFTPGCHLSPIHRIESKQEISRRRKQMKVTV